MPWTKKREETGMRRRGSGKGMLRLNRGVTTTVSIWHEEAKEREYLERRDSEEYEIVTLDVLRSGIVV
jgi:hypothetical protein